MHTTTRFPFASVMLAVAVLAIHSNARAVTSTGAPLLTLTIDPRLVGMGQTGTADNSDPSTIYFNPANAVSAPRAYAGVSKMDWPDDWFIDDLWAGRARAGYTWGSGPDAVQWGVDVTLGEFNYGESIATLPDGTPLGTYESFERMASLTAAAGLPCGDRYEVRIGVGAKRWWAKLAPAGFTQDTIEEEFDAYALDAGVAGVMHAAVNGWKVSPAIAVAMIDAGPDFDTVDNETDPLPRRFNFGANLYVESPARRLLGADVPVLTVSANLDGTRPRFDDTLWGLGSEISVAQVVFMRLGVHSTWENGDNSRHSAWGVGAGLPVSLLRVRFDYTESDYYDGTTSKHMGVTASWLF